MSDLLSKAVRSELRIATDPVHRRLHLHAGFAAIQARQLSLPRYRALLCRLLGFYIGYERIMAVLPVRSGWLEADLTWLGVERKQLAALPTCEIVPRADNRGRQLGARYVIEGSALGGRVLAAGLDGLLGPGQAEGRHYFLGYGDETGRHWRSLLEDLAVVGTGAAERRDIVEGALDTFSVFEMWLEDWETELRE